MSVACQRREKGHVAAAGGDSSWSCPYRGTEAGCRPRPQHRATLLRALGLGPTSEVAAASPRSLSHGSRAELTRTRTSFTLGGWDGRENRGTGKKPCSGALGTYKADSVWRGRVKEASPKRWEYLRLLKLPGDNWSLSVFSYHSDMVRVLSYVCPLFHLGRGRWAWHYLSRGHVTQTDLHTAGRDCGDEPVLLPLQDPRVTHILALGD